MEETLRESSKASRKDEVLKNKVLKWSMKRRSGRQKILALILAGMLFLAGIPSFLIFLTPIFDVYLALPRFMLNPLNFIIALLFIVPGFHSQLGRFGLSTR